MASIWKLYMLRCCDGSLYTGITTDVPARFEAHRTGHGAKYTRSHTPTEIAYIEVCGDHSAALKREIALKKLTKVEKEALVATYRSQIRRETE